MELRGGEMGEDLKNYPVSNFHVKDQLEPWTHSDMLVSHTCRFLCINLSVTTNIFAFFKDIVNEQLNC